MRKKFANFTNIRKMRILELCEEVWSSEFYILGAKQKARAPNERLCCGTES